MLLGFETLLQAPVFEASLPWRRIPCHTRRDLHSTSAADAVSQSRAQCHRLLLQSKRQASASQLALPVLSLVSKHGLHSCQDALYSLRQHYIVVVSLPDASVTLRISLLSLGSFTHSTPSPSSLSCLFLSLSHSASIVPGVR